MAELRITDMELARRLLQAAADENRSVEDLLAEMLNQREGEGAAPAPSRPAPPAMTLREAQLRTYERARRYWREVGDERAQMTDAELDEQFWFIDIEGVPHLKSEEGTVQRADTAFGRMVASADKYGFHSGKSDVSLRSREILNEEFADYLVKRKRGEYDTDASSGG